MSLYLLFLIGVFVLVWAAFSMCIVYICITQNPIKICSQLFFMKACSDYTIMGSHHTSIPLARCSVAQPQFQICMLSRHHTRKLRSSAWKCSALCDSISFARFCSRVWVPATCCWWQLQMTPFSVRSPLCCSLIVQRRRHSLCNYCCLRRARGSL